MASMVADLILTDAFLIKGNIVGKSQRLSKFLNDHHRHFLCVEGAAMVDLKSRQRINTPRVFVNLNEVILAHEFLDTAGDFYQKSIAKDREAVRIRAFYNGSMSLELAGRVRPKSYDGEDAGQQFFVMEAPQVRGLDLDGDADLQLLKNLSFVVINKGRLAYIYDFNG